MSTTDDMHAKMKLATNEEIWAPGGEVTDWTTDYDIRDADYVKDPVPIWAEMREQCPIAHTERLGGYRTVSFRIAVRSSDKTARAGRSTGRSAAVRCMRRGRSRRQVRRRPTSCHR